MVRLNEMRTNEQVSDAPVLADAVVQFIGRIRTPWTSRLECPRQGRLDGPICTIELSEPWTKALEGIAAWERLEILYWLHESRRDLLLQSPANDGSVRGTFAIRSPARPNPIGTSVVKLVEVDGCRLKVQGLDCLDGTPLLDIKPDRTLFVPIAPPQTGDHQTEPRR